MESIFLAITPDWSDPINWPNRRLPEAGDSVIIGMHCPEERERAMLTEIERLREALQHVADECRSVARIPGLDSGEARTWMVVGNIASSAIAKGNK